MSALGTLRRATAADLPAVETLQRAAYAKNRAILGVEPLPLLADYKAVLADHEVWLAEGTGGLDGVLILAPRADDLLIWSIATDPRAQGKGLGAGLLGAAEERARQLGCSVLRLYVGEKLTGNVAWYRRHGYAIERIETLDERKLVHMIKTIDRGHPWPGD